MSSYIVATSHSKKNWTLFGDTTMCLFYYKEKSLASHFMHF